MVGHELQTTQTQSILGSSTKYLLGTTYLSKINK